MRIAAAMPSPTSTTPAFSPGPTSTHSALGGQTAEVDRDDLYEQCSDHITAYIASSRGLASRPRIAGDVARPRRRSTRVPGGAVLPCPNATARRTGPRPLIVAATFELSYCAILHALQCANRCESYSSMPPTRRKKTAMSDAHKAALAQGRAAGNRAVRNYLEALEAHKPKRGRKRTPDSIKKRLRRSTLNTPKAISSSACSSRRSGSICRTSLDLGQAGVDLSATRGGLRDGREAIWRAQGHHLCRVAAGRREPDSAEEGRHQPR